jgi:hypothetical protein
MSPYHFGTKLMSVLNDWGRPPILIENNNNGQQVLDVLVQTHNYENVVSYHFEGFSKHYNNANRFGIHNHTNTRYKGISNFRYWANSLKAVKILDRDTILEIDNFVRLPNFTYTKKSDKDLDDRVFGLIWGLFILDPSLVSRYFVVQDTDEQGRPMKIVPTSNVSDLIKSSPLLIGGSSLVAKKSNYTANYSHVGGSDLNTGFDSFSEDRDNLTQWLLSLDSDKKELPLLNLNDEKDKSSIDTFYPSSVIF